MDLELSEFQKMVKDTARQVLSKECPPSLVRAAEKENQQFPQKLWKQMAELGWLSLVFPEEYGGVNANFSDIAILLEEAGRALPPVPLIPSIIGGLILRHFGNEAQKKKFLPRMAKGDFILSLAWLEEDGSYLAESINVKAKLEKEGYTLDGKKMFVPYGQMADLFLVAARTKEGKNPEDGLTLFLVDAHSPGINAKPLTTIAFSKQSLVSFDKVRVTEADILGKSGQAWPILEATMDWGATARCAEMLGIAQKVFEMAVAYTKERVQFEKPIGAFEIIHEYIADMATDLDGCRYSTWEAAWRLGEGFPAPSEVSVAKSWTSDACRRVVLRAHEIFGGGGFMEEHDLHLFTQWAKEAEVDFGDSAFHRERLARVLEQGKSRGIFNV